MIAGLTLTSATRGERGWAKVVEETKEAKEQGG